MHRIRRQILELELPREAGALALQGRVSRVFQEQVLPRLDEAFNRIAPDDRVVRIELLELDLGDIAEATWERDFVEKCVEQISLQVAEAAFAVGGDHPAVTFSAEENARLWAVDLAFKSAAARDFARQKTGAAANSPT